MSTPDHKHALPNGYVIQNSYRVIKMLGSGAFGITYLVEHIHFDSKHVVKEYLPESSIREGKTITPKSQHDITAFNWGYSRFLEEAKLLRKLNHPNLVRVTDLFETNGTAYFIMPYLGQYTLHSWFGKNPVPNEEQILSIFIPLLEGLKYIHGHQLLHRDIKPENILITDDGVPILIDFGSARNAIGRKSKMLTRVLTPHFAPIEQYSSNGTATEALDLYSLGGCIYQCVVGNLIPQAPDRVPDDSIVILGNNDMYLSRYSKHLLLSIDKSLNLYAKNRFQSADEMQSGLMGVIESPEDNEQQQWEQACEENTFQSYLIYLDANPYGKNIDEARLRVEEFKTQQSDESQWHKALIGNTVESYQQYLHKYPNGKYQTEAKHSIDLLCESANTKQETNSDDITKTPISIADTNNTSNVGMFALNGRIGRMRYFVYNVIGILITAIVIAFFAFIFLDSSNTEMFMTIAGLCLMVFTGYQITISRRRFHDLGQSGWLVILTLIPYVNFVAGIFLLFFKGQDGSNKYGLASVENTTKIKVIFYLCIVLQFIGLFGIAVLSSAYSDYLDRAEATQLEIQMKQAELESQLSETY